MTRQIENLQSTVVQQRETITRLKKDSEGLDKLKVPLIATATTVSWLAGCRITVHSRNSS